MAQIYCLNVLRAWMEPLDVTSFDINPKKCSNSDNALLQRTQKSCDCVKQGNPKPYARPVSITMARTKQTSKKSTGGPAERLTLSKLPAKSQALSISQVVSTCLANHPIN